MENSEPNNESKWYKLLPLRSVALSVLAMAAGFAAIIYSRYKNSAEIFAQYQSKLSEIAIGKNMVLRVEMINPGVFGAYSVLFFLGATAVLMGAIVIFVPMYRMVKKDRALAIEASMQKSQFLSNMSHEIRTPMNAILGMARIARNSTDPERIKNCLNQIEISSEILLGIINDVLDFSKIESGKFELSNEVFSLREIVDNIVYVSKVRGDEKEQRFTVTIADDVPDNLYADSLRFSQVILNLLSNAVKFTPKNGRVELSISLKSENGKSIVLRGCVSDTGIGLTKEQTGRLFQSFQQADGTITKKFGGTGLGLAICKKIITMVGGDIWVESEPDKGSRFIFDYPCETADSAALETLKDDGGELDLNGKCILVVEDIVINQEIIEIMLEDTGADIECAANGKEALDLISENPDKFDFIFMDVQMPIMDGYSATKAIRALGTEWAVNVPIVAMTANAFKEDAENALESGMNSHISKPVDEDKVFKALRKYLVAC